MMVICMFLYSPMIAFQLASLDSSQRLLHQYLHKQNVTTTITINTSKKQTKCNKQQNMQKQQKHHFVVLQCVSKKTPQTFLAVT